MIGNPNCNNPGVAIDWSIINKIQTSPPDSTSVTPGQKPKLPEAVGLYRFENVPQGDYVLVLSRPGYLPRYAKITILNDNLTVGHREIIGGDVNGDMAINALDINATNSRVVSKFNSIGNYEARFDINGDDQIDSDDVDLIRFFQAFHIEGYTDTLEWLMEHRQ
jgi:hypothetical protein